MSRSIGSLRETRDAVLNVEWKIEGFLSLPRSRDGYTSPIFKFSDSSWYLKINPYGDSKEDNADSVASYLYKTGANSEEIVAFEFGIKKANGVLCSKISCTWMFDKHQGYGSSEICTRSLLMQLKTEMLPSDALTLSCTLKKFPSPRGLNSLASDLREMLASTKHSDVTIHMKTKDYKAHKNILAARSSVFAAMFEHEMAEKNSGEVSIEDCDSESFKEFVGFLYTGRADITECSVAHLYKTADKYRVGELKSYCVAFLMQNLSVDNVCDVAALGDQYSDNDLENYCKRFLEDNIQDILQSSKWETFMKDNYRLAHKLLKSVAPKIKLEK